MPVLLHIADERNAEKIRRSGIKPSYKGAGIFAMPVLPNFYVTHQWLRELKSTGAKTMVGVYFRIDAQEMVYAGKYNQRHRLLPLGEAIREIMSLEDPLGYELILDRKVEASEIIRIKHLPQQVGWRYFPGSHNKKPCACEYCLRGKIKGKRTYDRLNDE